MENRTLKDMKAKEITARSLLLLAGLFCMAMGIAFSIKADLGTSPISSIAYVANQAFSITVGEATIILHCILILLQIVLLRKNYQPIQLLQLPVAFAFGFLTDLALLIINSLNPQTYLLRWIFCIISIVLISIGVSIEVIARVIAVAGEGFVLALSQVTKVKFSTLKICFDVSLVTIAAVLSLIFLRKIVGIREGTVAAAVFVGLINRFIRPLFDKLEKILFSKYLK